SRIASTRSALSRKYVKSGRTRSMPGMSASGNINPQSTTRMRPSTSRQKQFRPISPRPPRKTIRTASLMLRANVSPLCASLVDHAHRHRPQVLDDAHLRKQPQAVVGRVDLPPAKALARRALVAVVVVVPTLAGRDQRDDQRVAARVRGLARAGPPHARARVDE